MARKHRLVLSIEYPCNRNQPGSRRRLQNDGESNHLKSTYHLFLGLLSLNLVMSPHNYTSMPNKSTSIQFGGIIFFRAPKKIPHFSLLFARLEYVPYATPRTITPLGFGYSSLVYYVSSNSRDCNMSHISPIDPRCSILR